MSRRSIYTVKAGAYCWRGANSHMHLFCATYLPDHFYYFLARRTPYNGVVDHYHPLPLQKVAHRVELYFYAEMPDALFGLYKGPTYVVVSYETEIKGYP